MRFSDLNKSRAEEAARETPRKAPPKPAAPPPAAEEKPRPAEPAPKAVEPPPVEDRQEAVKHHDPAYRPPAKDAPKPGKPAAEPAVPFRDLDARAREVYGRMVAQAGDLLRGVSQPYTEKYEAVVRACGLAADELKAGSVLLNYTAYSTGDDYLRAHSANTAIIALAMGLASDLEASELKLLGFCAMAHDIGMPEYSDISGREAELTDEEFAAVTLHTEAGVDKLDRIVDLDYRVKDRAKRIILQTHERVDGSGYPDRLSDEEIDPLAQLIGIADVYEAMTHPRAWREALPPADVIKDLIEREGRGFNSAAVKALISALSIYPPGSFVQLSSGETARVIRISKGSLTRPLVEVLLDQDAAAASAQLIDLREHPLTSIERPVSLAELEELNPKLAARLELARWWTDW